MSNPTYFEALKWASLFIKKHQLEEESGKFLLLERQQWRETDLLKRYQDEMPDAIFLQFKQDVQRYSEGIPAQYVIGSAPFYGRTFKVNQDVLIPRPETEELVEWILMDNQQVDDISVLDVGTGSGAIGLSVKAEQPNWQVTVTDISAEALKVAEENSNQLKLQVELLKGDLLEPVRGRTFDIIVSNPPYIAADEVSLMDQSVIDYEPKMALFAEHNGLRIYERLAEALKQKKVKAKALYLEIGFKQAKAVKQIFVEAFPLARVTVKKDMENHDRMVRVDFEGSINDENGNL